MEAAMVAATDTGFVRMRVSKVVGLNDGDRVGEFVVLNELDGDRHGRRADRRCPGDARRQ